MSFNRRHRGYFDTNYDKNTPMAEYIRNRHKVNVAFFPDQSFSPDPSAAACKYCHEPLIVVDNGLNLFCQGCGMRTPTAKAKQAKKLVQKHGQTGSSTTPILLSQQDTDIRKREPGAAIMSDELREELEEKGYHPE